MTIASSSLRRSLKSQAGFSLIEITIALCILGLTLFIFAVNGTSSKQEAEISGMKVKAAELNLAMTRWSSLKGAIPAQNQWGSMSDADRYTTLTPWISHPPASLDKYVLEGFTITFPSTLRGGSVTLLDGNGNVLAY